MPNPQHLTSVPAHIVEQLIAWRLSAERNLHRALVVLSGERVWCHSIAQDYFGAAALAKIWLGDGLAETVPANKARQMLGEEYGLAVVDAWSGLHPDALAAVAGTVLAGGVLLLLVPPWDAWLDCADPDYARLATYPRDGSTLSRHFIAHIQQVLQAHAVREKLLVLHQQDYPAGVSQSFLPWTLKNTATALITPTSQQQQAMDALRVHRGVSVLLAERGRGKSAVLGFAARDYEAQGLRVLLCAPSRAAAGSVFRHAQVPVGFCAPDMLLQDETLDADVLLIDEAAAIPLPMLLQLLARFPHCVLATTTEGYEGTGQGFVLRFLRALDQRAPGWQLLRLQNPVRWAAGDPLEACLYDMLLLDAQESNMTTANVQTGSVQLECISQSSLLGNADLLRDVFGLLRSAHYRTTPDDLRFLLDGPAVSLYRLHHEGTTLAVVLLVEEGEIDVAMAELIAAGKRRPRGHMLVQTLAVHMQQPQYLQQRVARVVRIAVHTQYQRLGLGSSLLQAVVDDQQQRGVAYIGSSFSATPDVLAFWERNGFALLRIGHRKQAASAAPAALVLRHVVEV